MQYQAFRNQKGTNETNIFTSRSENQIHLTTRYNNECDTETPSVQTKELTNQSIIMPTRFGFMTARIKSHLNL